jgi:hypothetical protein
MSAPGAKIGRAMRPRLRVLVLAAGCLVLALAGIFTIVRLTSHGDPDPGGRILSALKSIESALPDGATEVTRQYAQPHWDSCDGREGTFGWSSIAVIVNFRTDSPADSLLLSASGPMDAAGWSKSRTLSSPIGPGQDWTRTLPDGTLAVASLTPGTMDNGATIIWQISAYAAAHGQHASGC